MLKINKEELCESLAYALLNDVIMPTLEANQCINFFVAKSQEGRNICTLRCNTEWEINPNKSEVNVIKGMRITSEVLETAVKLIRESYGAAKIEDIDSETKMYRFEA